MSFRKIKIAFATLAILFIVAAVYDRLLSVEKNARPYASSDSGENGELENENPDAAPDEEDAGIDLLASKAPELLPLFPNPSDWRRKTPNIFIPKGRECFFIYKGSHFISEDQKTVGLNACTFVLPAPQKEGHTLEDRIRNAIVFESTDRVELTFAEPLDKYAQGKGAKFDLSKFQEGHIWGQTIVRTKLGDADMTLRTREVVFNSKQIRSNFEVAFNIGPNSGTGVGFTIDLETPFRFVSNGGVKSLASNESSNPVDKLVGEGNLGAGFSLKGVQIDKLTGCVKFYSDSLASMRTKKPGEPEKEQSLKDNYYVEVRCKQDLYFSSNDNIVGGWCARFNKDVELDAIHDGVTDKIIADSVYLYLQDPELKALAETDADVGEAVRRKRITGALAKLEPAIVRALRTNSENPVVVRAKSQNVELNSDEIVYDLLNHTIELSSNDSSSPVRILQNENGNSVEFSSQLIKIQMNEDSDIEAVLSDRNGLLKAHVVNSDGQEQSFHATWAKGLRAVPTSEPEGYLQITSGGGVTFSAESMGDFIANEADFWFKLGKPQGTEYEERQEETAGLQRAPTAQSYAQENKLPSFSVNSLSEIKPIAADFRGDVSFLSSRGDARVSDSVRVRFDSVNDPEDADDAGPAQSSTNGAQLLANATEKESDSKFELQGSKLEVRCLLHYKPGAKNPTPEVVRMVLNNNVYFRERSLSTGAEKMSLDANAVQIDYPNSDAMKIRLVGTSDEPATFKTEKLVLTGSDVTVDSAQNFFQALGAGALKLVSPTQNANSNAADPQKAKELGKYLTDDPIEIRWTSAMEFDGRKLSFKSLDSQYVVVKQGDQNVLSPEVSLTLKKPLSIFKLDVNDKEALDVYSVECAGDPQRPVNIDVQTPSSSESDPRRARYTGQFMNLKYFPESGRFVASGGGEFRGVIPSSGKSFSSIADVAAANGGERVEPKENTEPNWTKIHAKFQGELVGETTKQAASIKNGVRIAFAAVDDPNVPLDVDSPSDCPEDYASIESREAYVKFLKGAQNVNYAAKNSQDLELEASQNVLFKQKDYVGVCETLRYVSQKQTVVLAGGSSNKAAIYRQPYPGAPRERMAEFSRATYQLDTQKFSVEAFSHTN